MNTLNFSNENKTLPYNFLAERLVLGSILINPDVILIVSQHLTVETFYLKAHQIIYTGMLLLYAEEKSIDYVTLTTLLHDNKFVTCLKDLSKISDFFNQVVAIGY